MTLHDRKSLARRAETTDKALALDEIATQIDHYLPPDSGITREDLISKIIGIIEARTNYLFLRRLKSDWQARQAEFRMTASERRDEAGEWAPPHNHQARGGGFGPGARPQSEVRSK